MKPLGKASQSNLDKQVYWPHRANGYVKHMVSHVGQTLSDDPICMEGGKGEPDAAHKQTMAVWRRRHICRIMIHHPGYGPSGNQSAAGCRGCRKAAEVSPVERPSQPPPVAHSLI